MRKFLRRCWRKTALIPLALVAVLIGTILPASAVLNPIDRITVTTSSGCKIDTFGQNIYGGPFPEIVATVASVNNSCEWIGIKLAYYDSSTGQISWGPAGSWWGNQQCPTNQPCQASSWVSPPTNKSYFGRRVYQGPRLSSSGPGLCWSDSIYSDPVTLPNLTNAFDCLYA